MFSAVACRARPRFERYLSTSQSLPNFFAFVELWVEPMGTVYRIYTRDDDGHFVGVPREIVCKDDAEAIKQAMQIKDGKALEVWDHDRQVAEIK
jgi:hypothetical protein